VECKSLKHNYAARGYICSSITLKGNWLRVKLRRDKRFGYACTICGNKKMRVTKRYIAHARDCPQNGFAVLAEIQYPSVQTYCKECEQHHTFRPSLIHPKTQATLRFMEYVADLCQDMPAQKVAQRLQLSPTTVCEWDKRILKNRLPAPDLDQLEVLLVDEKAVRKGHHYVTVVMNERNREVLHMSEGRKGESLMSFFEKLTKAQKRNVKAVGIDRGGAYLAAVKAALPQADIVFDKFHILANLNDAIDDIRREEYRHAVQRSPKMAKLLKGQRYNLFRLAENRTERQTLRLRELLEANAVLSSAHALAEQLRVLWTYWHRGYAERFLRNWVSMVEESGIVRLIRFARYLWRSREGVVNFVLHRITSGPLEALNGTIERILRRSCGMRDIDYLFLKVRQESLA
jgi:transposase